MRPVRLLTSLLVLATAACGDDGSTPLTPDAPGLPPLDAAADATTDAPPARCAYTEAQDATNDDIYGTGAPEATGLTVTSRTVLCGSVDETHFDSDELVVDIDGFVVTLATEADILLTLSAPGGAAIELFTVEIYGGTGLTQYFGSADFAGDHGVLARRLPAGAYEFAMAALHTEALTAPVPYEIQIAIDAPETRCPALTSGGYAEADDGAANNGNDVVGVLYGASPVQSLTTLPTDAPEPTALTIEPGTNYRLAGALADIATPDSYEDKDTYQFTTGAATNQLAVRLNWGSATADLDYFLFEADALPALGSARSPATVQPEFGTFAVKPNTSYWLWVGADAVRSTNLPATYSASVCGATFTP